MALTNETADTEIVLEHDDLRGRVSPYGASLRGLWRETASAAVDIVTGYSGAKNKMGGQGDVLIPFPGRVKGGAYEWNGQAYQMELSDKEGPNAIHGFLRTVPWQTAEQSANSATFVGSFAASEHEGYPFALEATVTYSLDQTGLTCRFSVKNTGEQAAPVGVGFHPYFTVGGDLIDSDVLQVPFASVLQMEKMIPTGAVLPVEETPFDFRAPRLIAQTKFNTCYASPAPDADGKMRVKLATATGDRALTVWMDDAFGFVVVYSGDPMPESHRRKSLAIEPMTCGSDSFNHPDWGLKSLAPGETWGGAWGVTPQ